MGAKNRRAEFPFEKKNIRSLSIGMWLLFATIITLYLLCAHSYVACASVCVLVFNRIRIWIRAWTWAHVCRCSSFFHHQPPPSSSTIDIIIFPTLNFFNCQDKNEIINWCDDHGQCLYKCVDVDGNVEIHIIFICATAQRVRVAFSVQFRKKKYPDS